MSTAILTGYDELIIADGNTDFSIVKPSPVKSNSTKVKRWWREAPNMTTYEHCALIDYANKYIVVSIWGPTVNLKITKTGSDLSFDVGHEYPGDGNVRRIQVVDKASLHNPTTYDDYYYNYSTKLFVKNTIGFDDGIFVNAALNLHFSRNKSLVDSTTGSNLVTFARNSKGTYVDSSGVIQSANNNVPRFGHDPDSLESLGLLIEGSRTNRLIYSRLTSSGSGLWQATAPSGATATWSPLETQGPSFESANNFPEAGLATRSNGGDPRIIDSVNITGANTILTLSVFCKQYQSEEDFEVVISNIAGVSTSSSTININSGSSTLGTGFSSASVKSYPNSWKRVAVTYTVPSSATGTTATISLRPAGTSSGMYLWGAQLEEGDFASSFIFTSNVAATRAADNATITGTNFSGFYNQNEGTIFVDAETNVVTTGSNFLTSNSVAVDFTGSSFLDRHSINFKNGVISTIGGSVSNFNTMSLGNVAPGSSAKFSYGYKTDDLAAAKDGGTAVTDNSATISTAITQASLGKDTTSTYYIFGHIKRIAYFSTRRTNAEIVSMTS